MNNSPSPQDERAQLIDQSLKLNRPKFTSRIYYSLLLFFGVLLLVTLADFPTEANIGIIALGAAALIALWVSYAVKMRKYKKWYEENYAYLASM